MRREETDRWRNESERDDVSFVDGVLYIGGVDCFWSCGDGCRMI